MNEKRGHLHSWFMLADLALLICLTYLQNGEAALLDKIRSPVSAVLCLAVMLLCVVEKDLERMLYGALPIMVLLGGVLTGLPLPKNADPLLAHQKALIAFVAAVIVMDVFKEQLCGIVGILLGYSFWWGWSANVAGSNGVAHFLILYFAARDCITWLRRRPAAGSGLKNESEGEKPPKTSLLLAAWNLLAADVLCLYGHGAWLDEICRGNLERVGFTQWFMAAISAEVLVLLVRDRKSASLLLEDGVCCVLLGGYWLTRLGLSNGAAAAAVTALLMVLYWPFRQKTQNNRRIKLEWAAIAAALALTIAADRLWTLELFMVPVWLLVCLAVRKAGKWEAGENQIFTLAAAGSLMLLLRLSLYGVDKRLILAALECIALTVFAYVVDRDAKKQKAEGPQLHRLLKYAAAVPLALSLVLVMSFPCRLELVDRSGAASFYSVYEADTRLVIRRVWTSARKETYPAGKSVYSLGEQTKGVVAIEAVRENGQPVWLYHIAH